MTLFMRDQENKELGRSEGKLLNTIALVRKKLVKGLSPEDIADILEENVGTIEMMTHFILEHPEYSDEDILKEFKK